METPQNQGPEVIGSRGRRSEFGDFRTSVADTAVDISLPKSQISRIVTHTQVRTTNALVANNTMAGSKRPLKKVQLDDAPFSIPVGNNRVAVSFVLRPI
jgi:hypothetical protein